MTVAFGLRWRNSSGRLAAENCALRAKCEIPDFESVVRIPRNVPSGENKQYELARIDAWVLTHDMFSDLKRGEISCDEAVQELSDLAKCAREDELDNQFPPYDELEIYSGDFDVRNALVRLLSDAMTNLQEGVQK